MSADGLAKLDIAPFVTDISAEAKLLVDSLDRNVNAIVASFVVEPLATPDVDDVIPIVGAVPSYVQLNVLETLFGFPTVSVNLLAVTLIVFSPSPLGVNVAVYVVPEPEKLDSEPFVTVISPTTKLAVDSVDVNVKTIVASFVVAPVFTTPPFGSTADIVMFGDVPSYVQLNGPDVVLLFPTASVNLLPATFIVAAPSAVGVNVAVYVVPEPENELSVPFDTEISVFVKSVVVSVDVNVKVKAESFVVRLLPSGAPLASTAVIVIPGAVPSYVQLYDADCDIVFPTASENVPGATLIVAVPLAVGVNVAVYVVPEPANALNAPFVTDISELSKSVVASVDVNVKAIVASFVVELLPRVTRGDPCCAVIAMVGGVLSYVQVNCVAA